MGDGLVRRVLRPVIVFPLLALLVVVATIVMSEPEMGEGASQLTTYGTGPFAARGIYDVLGRLGIAVSRRRVPFRAPLDTSATYLLLDPPMPPSATEVHALLGAVRGGATAIVVPSPGTPLADSVGAQQSEFPAGDLDVRMDTGSAGFPDATAALRSAAMAHRLMSGYLLPVPRSDSDTAARFPADARVLVRVNARDSARPAIIARPMGRGWVVALGDAAWLRNYVVRDTAAAILAVRLVEWPSSTPRRPLVFDEYHQGFGLYQSSTGTIVGAVTGTRAGHVLMQLLAAGLVLLVAVGVRPIAPRARAHIERRSPLEHVGALARAYEQIRATRLATQRLVHGLRRRHPLGLGPAADDQRYLDLVRERAPSLASDVALVRDALDRPLSAADWVRVGGSIDHIERTIRQ